MDKSSFGKLVSLVKNATDSFKNFDEKVLIKYPKSILLYRSLLGMNQTEFCERIGISRRYLVYLEGGGRKNIREKTAKKIMSKILPELKEIDFINLNYPHLYGKYLSSNIKGKINPNRLRNLAFTKDLKGVSRKNISNLPDNEFEEYVLKILEKNKIPFELHSIIRTKNKCLVVDFAIPDSKNPKVIIEVKQTKTKKVKSQYETIKSYSISLDHKMRGIKLGSPQINCVVVLGNKHNPLASLSPYISAEFLDTDKVFIDSTVAMLPGYIKSKL